MSSEVASKSAGEIDAGEVARLMRDPFDWFAVLAIIGLSPGMCILLIDLWQRTDLRFAPVLPLVSLVLVWRSAKFEEQPNRNRSIATFVVLILGACSAGAAVVASSAWLCTLALWLILTGWMLERFGKTRWPFFVCSMIPFALLLVFPIADATDLTRNLERWVAGSTGTLLDLIGVPNLVAGNAIELRDGLVSASAACRWIGNPYLLLTLTTLYMVLRQKSFLVGALTAASVPMWALLGGVIHFTAGIYLLIQQDINILSGTRGLMSQAGVLVFLLLCVVMLQRCFATFLLPFVAFAGTGAELHKLYNRVVYWPSRDPLRRRSSETNTAATISRGRNAMIGLAVVGLCIAIAGVMVSVQVSGGKYGQRIAAVHVFENLAQANVKPDMLPGNLRGMRMIDFVERRDVGMPFSDRYRATWIYQRGLDRVEITLRPSHRGAVQLESEYLTSLSRIGEPSQASTIEMQEFGQLLLDEVVLLDDLYGRSYLSYAMVANPGIQPFRTIASGAGLGRTQLQESLAVQPSLASVAVFVEGSSRLSEEERNELREVLLAACVALSGKQPVPAVPASE